GEEEQLRPRPGWVHSTAGRDLPLATGTGKRPYVHLVRSRFVGEIRQPPAIGREHRLLLDERRPQKKVGLPLFQPDDSLPSMGRIQRSGLVSTLSSLK